MDCHFTATVRIFPQMMRDPLFRHYSAIVRSLVNFVSRRRISSSTGRDVATVGGAVTGAVIGNAIDRQRAGITVQPVTRDVQRCRTVETGRDVLDGYDVTYRYQNRDFTTRLANHPGDRIQVRVDVAPMPG